MNPPNQPEGKSKFSDDKQNNNNNENYVSIIDNDVILNFLNEYENNSKNYNFNNYPNTHQLTAFGIANLSNFEHPQNFNQDYNPLFSATDDSNKNFSNIYKEHSPQLRLPYPHLENPITYPMNANKEKNFSDEIKEDKQIIQKEEENSQSKSDDNKNLVKQTYVEKIKKLMEKKVSESHHFSSKKKSRPLEVKYENTNVGEKPNTANTASSKIQKSGLPSTSDLKSLMQIGKNFRSTNLSHGEEKQEEYDKLNKKLEKNRESARNSRKRKKIYIELLENKVSELSTELDQTKKVLDVNNQQLNKISHHSRFINNLLKGKQQIFEKLERFNEPESHPDDQELNLLIDSLRLRLGATGKERVNAINFLFKQIFNLILPNYIRFLLLNSNEVKKDESKENKEAQTNTTCLPNEMVSGENEGPTKLVREINLTDHQKKLLYKYKKKFFGENIKFKGLIENLNNLRKFIHKQTANVENIVDELRNYFNPNQIMKYLLLTENDKNNKVLNPFKMWIQKEKRDEDSDYSHFSDFYEDDEEEPNEEDQTSQRKDTSKTEPGDINTQNLQEKSRKKKHLNE